MLPSLLRQSITSLARFSCLRTPFIHGTRSFVTAEQDNGEVDIDLEVEKAKASFSNPANIGSFVTLGDADFMNAFNELGLPEHINSQFEATDVPALMHRKPAMDLAVALDKIGANPGRKTRAMLVGARGVGKSVYVLQTVRHALNNEWIVVYVPSITKFTRPIYSTARIPSLTGKGNNYLMPDAAVSMMKQVMNMNGDKLKSVNLPQSFKLGSLSWEANEATLFDVLDKVVTTSFSYGSQQPSEFLRITLDALSKHQESPVLIALDQVNALWSDSGYRDEDSSALNPATGCFPDLTRLLNFVSGASSLNYGCILSATSLTDPCLSKTVPPEIAKQQDSVVHVQPFTKEEHNNYVKGMDHLGSFEDPIDAMTRDRIFRLTGGVPLTTFNVVASM